jgi:hypothetical protein
MGVPSWLGSENIGAAAPTAGMAGVSAKHGMAISTRIEIRANFFIVLSPPRKRQY